MKLFKKITSWVSTILITCILIYFVGMYFWPDEISEFAGYRFYTILTGSMEPTIPTDSLVLTKILPTDAEIKPNTIITFHADRFGDDIVLTHYFQTTEKTEEGKTIYRTQAEGVDNYDDYQTKRTDIIGTYVGHVPFLGKVFLFLQSAWGLLTLLAILGILMINRIISMRLEKAEDNGDKVVFKEKKHRLKEENPNQGIIIRDTDMLVMKHSMQMRGTVVNQTTQNITFLKVKIKFTDKEGHVIDSVPWYMVGAEGLGLNEEKRWSCTIERDDRIEKCQFEILSCRRSWK